MYLREERIFFILLSEIHIFSDVTEKHLKHLYGAGYSQLEKNMWALLVFGGRFPNMTEKHRFGANINLKKFYAKTTPNYYLYFCQINEVNCVRYNKTELVWERVPVKIFPL